MIPFSFSIVLVFLAEMGDKTQFTTAALATRYSWRLVLAALTVATLVSHLLSVWLGEAVSHYLPDRALEVVAGVAFIGFGLWTLRADNGDDEETPLRRMSPFAALTLTFFTSEIGDKTMLMTVALAARYKHALTAVWLGSTIGMLAADALAIAVGRKLLTLLPERLLRPATAAIFLVTGAAMLARVFLSSPAGHV